jgi:hypothetical protein
LSQIARELSLASEELAPKILARHPRYKELCEDFGEPQVQRSTNGLNSSSLAASLVKVQFHVVQPDHPSGSDKQMAFELELPKRLSIYAVLGLVGKRVGLSPFQIKLFWETGEWEFKRAGYVDDDEQWDSEDADDEAAGTQGKILREIQLIPGTRSLGTWVEGSQAAVRIEIEGDDQAKRRVMDQRPSDFSFLE